MRVRQRQLSCIWLIYLILNVASRTNVSRKTFHFYALCNEDLFEKENKF